MAISAGILIQVFLVILLGREEIAEGFQLHSQLRAGFFFFRLIERTKLGKHGFIRIVNTGPVLDAFIMSLTIDRQRVDDHEVVLQQLRQGDAGLIKVDTEGFSMTAVSTDILIGRCPSNWSKNFCIPQKQPPAR